MSGRKHKILGKNISIPKQKIEGVELHLLMLNSNI